MKEPRQRGRETLHTGYVWTHLSLADVSTLLADNAVDNGPMVEPLNKCTTSSAHKRVLQCTEQNPVQLLHIMLICPLRVEQKKNQIKDRKTSLVLPKILCTNAKH